MKNKEVTNYVSLQFYVKLRPTKANILLTLCVNLDLGLIKSDTYHNLESPFSDRFAVLTAEKRGSNRASVGQNAMSTVSVEELCRFQWFY